MASRDDPAMHHGAARWPSGIVSTRPSDVFQPGT